MTTRTPNATATIPAKPLTTSSAHQGTVVA